MKFTASNFMGKFPSGDCHLIADVANTILKEWLDAAPTVHGWYPGTYPNGTWTSSETVHSTSTHIAKLVCIKSINHESCRHEPTNITASVDNEDNIVGFYSKCKHCGLELVADWKVK